MANANNQPLYILAGGILIDSLLLSLFLFLSQANRRAIVYADQLTEKLEVEKQNLEKSNRDLEQFAYVASHDLKSPLNAIDKLVGWLEEDLGEQIPETSQKHMDLLRNRTSRMSNLLDDLLGYSQVSRYEYQPETIRLGRLVEDNLVLLDKPETFTVLAEDFELQVPRVPFELVLRNLISNAVKHHDRDTGTVRVSAQKTGNDYHLRVADDGPGIPPELHDRALEMFRSLQSRDKVEGNGMGLAMAKRVVEHYGGSLEIESDGVRGTAIVICWPGSGERE